jgi:hypothetical protein
MFRYANRAKALAMRRWLSLLLLLFLGQCLSGSTPGVPTRVMAQRLVIASTPVMLDSSDPKRRQLGRLTYLGGWHLTSAARVFGGLSAIDVNANQITAVSDVGAIIRFRFGRFGAASDAQLVPVPIGCGPTKAKTDNDTESLAHDSARKNWWIGTEYRNTICKTDADFTVGRFVAPHAMANWPKKRGPETLFQLNDGRLLTIAEQGPDQGALRPALLFSGDPTDTNVQIMPLSYRPPEGFDPTDATQLPDGRILVLNRRFSLPALFTGQLVLIDKPIFSKGAILSGQVIARFESPVITDNFEGISVSTENGRTIVWIVSDNNYMRWERTLVLKFALN